MREPSRGVTLVEMMIVVAIVSMIAAVSFPSVAAGLDQIRLRSAADSVVGFLNVALNRVERREQPVEVVVSPQENAVLLFSAEPGYQKKLEMPSGVKISGGDPREFLLMPGAAPPAMDIDIYNTRGAHKLIKIDPITGLPQS